MKMCYGKEISRNEKQFQPGSFYTREEMAQLNDALEGKYFFVRGVEVTPGYVIGSTTEDLRGITRQQIRQTVEANASIGGSRITLAAIMALSAAIGFLLAMFFGWLK
jgi:hypothetical protein